jgi:hypothetical protein
MYGQGCRSPRKARQYRCCRYRSILPSSCRSLFRAVIWWLALFARLRALTSQFLDSEDRLSLSERRLRHRVLALFVQHLTIGTEFLDLGKFDRVQLRIGCELLVNVGHVLRAAIGERRAGDGDSENGG